MKTHRSNVYCRNGAVAASQPLAVAAGLETLRRGGTAIDAAITVSAVLSVIEPGASHLAEMPLLLPMMLATSARAHLMAAAKPQAVPLQINSNPKSIIMVTDQPRFPVWYRLGLKFIAPAETFLCKRFFNPQLNMPTLVSQSPQAL